MFNWKNRKISKHSNKTYAGKVIMITGGCGSIGSEIVRQLLQYNPKQIRIFDCNESGLFDIQQELRSSKIRLLVGDVRNKDRLRFAVKGVDIIFHAAALKHVPLCEYNPFEAVTTNVIGTQNLVEVARDEQVEKLISISTDKAVNPINTMGATKLLAEKIVMTSELGINCKTKFSCVRFGNVLNSVGSVIPIFKRQIKRGGPVTITSPEMERFFMSMPEAVHLVLRSGELTKGKDIFILKMRTLNILELAKVMIEELAPKFGFNPKDIKLKSIGVRPGEKMKEYLVTDEEKDSLLDLGDLYVLQYGSRLDPFKLKEQKSKVSFQELNNGSLLAKDEIRELLHHYDLV